MLMGTPGLSEPKIRMGTQLGSAPAFLPDGHRSSERALLGARPKRRERYSPGWVMGTLSTSEPLYMSGPGSTPKRAANLDGHMLSERAAGQNGHKG